MNNLKYETEAKDYSVPEFYREFGHKLPQVVRVSQGFYGDIVEDTFDKDQLLRIQTVSRQRRVVARWRTYGQISLYSFPLSFEEKLCVRKKNKHKVGKEKTIQQIVAEKQLPVEVMFPRDRTLHVSGQTLHTNHLPTMELTQVFEEMYLMGNFLLEDNICTDVVPVPLYLGQLRLSVVTGIKDDTEGLWETLLSKMAATCATVTYKQDFGSPDIAVYHAEAVHNETEYSYAEPASYTSFAHLFRGPPDQEISHDGNVYEVIGDREQTKNSKQTSGVPPPIKPKPKNTTPIMTSFNKSSNDVSVPSLPPRQTLKSSIKKMDEPCTPNPYSNYIPTTTVSPMVPENRKSNENAHELTDVASVSAVTDNTADIKQCASQESSASLQETPKLKALSSGDAVATLNMDEVGEYLKVLKLDKYVDIFKENLIDGQLLRELDKDILNESFGMKGLEVIRLMKFVKDGHVPS